MIFLANVFLWLKHRTWLPFTVWEASEDVTT